MLRMHRHCVYNACHFMSGLRSCTTSFQRFSQLKQDTIDTLKNQDSSSIQIMVYIFSGKRTWTRKEHFQQELSGTSTFNRNKCFLQHRWFCAVSWRRTSMRWTQAGLEASSCGASRLSRTPGRGCWLLGKPGCAPLSTPKPYPPSGGPNQQTRSPSGRAGRSLQHIWPKLHSMSLRILQQQAPLGQSLAALVVGLMAFSLV